MAAEQRRGLGGAELRRYLELKLITAGGASDPAALMPRLRRIRRFRRYLGLSPGAVAIIVRLLDRMEALERPTAARPRP